VGKQVQIKPFLSKEDNSHHESKALPLALQRARHAKTFKTLRAKRPAESGVLRNRKQNLDAFKSASIFSFSQFTP